MTIFRSRLLDYSVALLTVALAMLFVFEIPPLLRCPSALFLAAVIVTAWHGGFGPGLLATVLAGAVLNFILPSDTQIEVSLTGPARLALFAFVGTLICVLTAQQKRLAESLRQRDRRKDDFLAVLAHELRSPLSAALTALEVLHFARPETMSAERAMEIVKRQAEQMARLIDDLLDVSRSNHGKISLRRVPVDLTEVVAEAVESVRSVLEARGHRLECRLSAQALVFEGDPVRLKQIIVNLLSNASKYTNPGGQIWLTLERMGQEIVLRVRDTGIGIAPEMLPHVFELFVQGNDGSRGGLGIGLSLVRTLVQMHGGNVRASSVGPGQGSEFTVAFPLGRPSNQAVDVRPDPRMASAEMPRARSDDPFLNN